jgi:hypothetical protein
MGIFRLIGSFFEAIHAALALGVEKNTKRGEAQKPAFKLNTCRGEFLVVHVDIN